jgi:Flp pilus assembly protein CpaB
MTYRLRNIAVAVGLALVAALLTTFYVANYKRHVRQGESTVKVYVAKRDVPQGTSGAEMIKRHLMVTSDVTARTVVPGYVSSPDQVASLLTTQTIFAGEQVTLRRFASHAQQGIRSQLHGTLRALSLPGTNDQLLAGILKAGDHVDLLANLKVGGSGCSGACFAVRVVGRNLLVLQAPNTGPDPSKVGTGNSSVVLAVSDRRESQKVFYAVQNAAGWTLQLRPVANATDTPYDMESNRSEQHDDITPANLQHFLGSGR